jgi:hypothetical protein
MPEAKQPNDRWSTALSAVGTALLLDAADLITFGPIGVWTGLLLGGLLGWGLAPQLGFPGRRWLPSILAGLYCMMPGTALMPLAAIFVGVRSLSAPVPPPIEPPVEPRAEPGAIEAEYKSRWDDESSDPRD